MILIVRIKQVLKWIPKSKFLTFLGISVHLALLQRACFIFSLPNRTSHTPWFTFEKTFSQKIPLKMIVSPLPIPYRYHIDYVQGRYNHFEQNFFGQIFFSKLDQDVREVLFGKGKIKQPRLSRAKWTGMPKNVKNFDFGIDFRICLIQSISIFYM